MTDERKYLITQRLKSEWEAEKLLQAFVYYSQRFNPLNDEDDDNIKYYLIRAEILRRME